MRKARSGDSSKQSVFVQKGIMVDTATQTANNASTQTSDTESGNEEHVPATHISTLDYIDPPRAPETKTTSFRVIDHRRSSSWDPPSQGGDKKGGNPNDKNQKSMVMLSQILKEKRDLEIKKERDRLEQQRIQQEQQRIQQEQQRLQQEQQRLQQEPRHRRKESMTKLGVPIVSVMQPTSPILPPTIHVSPVPHLPVAHMPVPLSPHHAPPVSPTHLAAAYNSTTLSPHLAAAAAPVQPPTHTQALRVAHHARSKSDPNVAPLLFRGLHTPAGRSGAPGMYGASPQLASAIAAMQAAQATQQASAQPLSARARTSQNEAPRSSSSMSSRRTISTISPLASPIAPLSPQIPITDKQKELLELEKKIEAQQRKLMDKGFNVLPFVPKEERRRDWSSILELKDNDLLTSLEDIEEEIETIKQRTMDIQDQVHILERCVAPDPLSMMFGDHGPKKIKRVSPYNPTASPIYNESSPFTSYSETSFKRMQKYRSTSPTHSDYSSHSDYPPSPSATSSFVPIISHREAPVRPQMSKYSTSTSPTTGMHMGPDMTKRRNLGPRSAFSPTPQDDSSDHSAFSPRSAFSPPPRAPSQEDVRIHWTRL